MTNLFGWLLGLLSAALAASLMLYGLAWASGGFTACVMSKPVAGCRGWEKFSGPTWGETAPTR
jgi:hypothetical protein